jgi:hypothetical protein
VRCCVGSLLLSSPVGDDFWLKRTHSRANGRKEIKITKEQRTVARNVA